MRIPTRTAAAGVLACTIAACGGSDDPVIESPAPEFGTLNLGISDAPVDSATRVVVEFTGVELQPASGERELFGFNEPRQIDLLALHGGEVELLLNNETLPAGRYNFILLQVNAEMNVEDSFIELEDGRVFPLFIPSGAEQGLRLVQGFDVPANGTADFTIDFDLRKSVVAPPGQADNYFLRPALRLVDNSEVGAIAGTVAQDLITDPCSPSVYVYEGPDQEPVDVSEDAGPVVSALVEMDDATGLFEYRAAFLTAGDYTVAFTCEADQDAPDAVDDIAFTGGTATATVDADETAEVNFPVGG